MVCAMVVVLHDAGWKLPKNGIKHPKTTQNKLMFHWRTMTRLAVANFEIVRNNWVWRFWKIITVVHQSESYDPANGYWYLLL